MLALIEISEISGSHYIIGTESVVYHNYGEFLYELECRNHGLMGDLQVNSVESALDRSHILQCSGMLSVGCK